MVTELNVKMTLQGASGKTYLFNLYGYDFFSQLKRAFKPISAIYVFSHRYMLDGAFTHDIIYLGQTSNLAERFDNHHKESDIIARNGNCIWIHVFNGTDDQRAEVEQDILASYDFPCNEVNN